MYYQSAVCKGSGTISFGSKWSGLDIMHSRKINSILAYHHQHLSVWWQKGEDCGKIFSHTTGIIAPCGHSVNHSTLLHAKVLQKIKSETICPTANV